jgi:hypothetical protein
VSLSVATSPHFQRIRKDEALREKEAIPEREEAAAQNEGDLQTLAKAAQPVFTPHHFGKQ